MVCRRDERACDSSHVGACFGSQRTVGFGRFDFRNAAGFSNTENQKPRPAFANGAKTRTGHPLLITVSRLSPVVAVVPAIIVAIAVAAIGAVGAPVSALVAFAVLVFVVAFMAHPVLVAAGVFPVVVLELEAASALGIVLTGAKTVTIAVPVAALAGFVAAIVVAVIIVASP